MAERRKFVVEIYEDGEVASVDGKTDWQLLANNKEALTGSVVPLEILRLGALICVHSGCRII